MRSPKDFFKPLAVGAPDPVREIPFRPSRMIHFFPPHLEKVTAKLPDIAPTVDVLLGNLEDAIPMDHKEAARNGLMKVAKEIDFGDTQLWTRINSLDIPVVARRPHTASSARSAISSTSSCCPRSRGLGYPLRRPTAGPARGEGRTEKADPGALPAGDRARRGQCGRDRQRQPAHPGH